MIKMEEQYVKFIRLSTGEDLISEITEISETGKEPYYMLHNPYKVVYLTSSKPGFYSVSLMQWVFPKICSKQEFNIFKKDIIMISDVNDDLCEYYWDSIEHYENDTSNHESKAIEDDLISTGDMIEFIKEYLANTKGTIH